MRGFRRSPFRSRDHLNAVSMIERLRLQHIEGKGGRGNLVTIP